MAVSVDQIRILVKAETAKAIKNLKGVHGQSQKVSMGFKEILTTGLGIAGVAGAIRIVAEAVKKAVKISIQFEQSITNVATLSGIAKDELALLARQMGRDTVFTATECSDALFELAKAGLKSAEAMRGVLRPALDLAVIGEMNLADATKTIVVTANVFDIAMTDSARIANVFAKAATSATINVQYISEAMQYFGPVANRMGMSLEAATAAVATLGKKMPQASMAGTALRMAYSKLIRPSNEMLAIFKKTGINLDDLRKNLAHPVKLFRILHPAIQKTGNAEKIFGIRAAVVASIIKKGNSPLEDMTENLKNLGTYAQDLAEKRLNTVAGRWKEFNSAVEEIIHSLVSSGGLMPALKDIVEGLRDITRSLGDFINSSVGIKMITIAVKTLGIAFKLVYATAIQPSFEFMWVLIKTTIEALVGLGKTIKNVFKFEWKKALIEANNALDNMKNTTVNSVRRIKNTWKGMGKDIGKIWKTITKDYSKETDKQSAIAAKGTENYGNEENKKTKALEKETAKRKKIKEKTYAEETAAAEKKAAADEAAAEADAAKADADEVRRLNYLGYKMETEMIAETQRYENLKALAKQYNWNIEELETAHNLKMADIAMKHFKEKSDMFLGSATSINNSLIKINKARLDSIDKDDKKARDKVIEELNRLWEWQRGLAMTQAGINAAAAVLKTMASVPYPLNIPLAALQGAAGAAQIAAMAMEKKPEYARGTESAAAGMALVGERGPELVNFKGGEQVIPNNRISNYTTNANRSIVIENVSLPNVTDTKEMLLEMQEIADNMGTSLLNV